MILQKHLSIRRILALVSLLFLLLPVGGIYFLRIYESALIRQTESELISQGAFVSAIYKHEVNTLLQQAHRPIEAYGLPLYNRALEKEINPIFPQLDLAKDRVHAARPNAYYTKDKLDSVAEQAGKQMMPVLSDAQRITLSGIKILDYQGLVVAGRQEKGLSFSQVEEFQEARKGKPVSFLRVRRMSEKSAALGSFSRNSNINVFVALPMVLEHRLIGVVWLNRTPMDLSQALYGKRHELIWTILVLVLMAILMARLTSLTITQPIRALVKKTQLIQKGDPAGLKPLNVPITGEVSELSENIARMATTIQNRSEYIQNFTAHLSHEFKTPLTAIQGGVELLQDHLEDMPQAQQRQFLNNIAQDTDRLGRLVSRLMELTRADMLDRFDQSSDLRLLLQEIMADNPAIPLQIQVILPPDHAPLLVAMSPESMQAVLGHLLENSKQAGADRVDIQVNQQEADIILDIMDNGPGISDANLNNIFTPFFTTKRSQGGTGLGLSIIKSLLERYQGRISVESASISDASRTSGAHFRITLPRS
jgi:signal transduction histidine kinase